MQDAFIYDGLRSPIGRHAGGLAPVRPDDLLGGVIKAVVGRNPFKPGDYEDAVVGCTNQAGEDALFIAGGVESMSRAPFVMAKAESPYSREMKLFDSTIGARFPNPRIAK